VWTWLVLVGFCVRFSLVGCLPLLHCFFSCRANRVPHGLGSPPPPSWCWSYNDANLRFCCGVHDDFEALVLDSGGESVDSIGVAFADVGV
jgi:hypothetical protein